MVKRWAADLDDAGVVFPNFANYMSRYIKKSEVRGRLFDNARKTGKYIWEKDTLIDLTFPQLLDRVVEEFPTSMPSSIPQPIIPGLMPSSGMMSILLQDP